MELLLFLTEKQGQLVTREEIIERIWGKGVFFDAERGVNNAIRKIRSALNDDSEKPRFIETVIGRGYRFIAPVECASPAIEGPPVESTGNELTVNGSPGTSRAAKTWLAAAGLTAIAAAAVFGIAIVRERFFRPRASPEVRSLAVLPLENLSGDPGQDYFADGMTDALITDLAHISSLRVISRTSAMRYKGVRRPVPEIAKELNVDAVIEGTVVRSGGRVRITAQLIEASSDRHLWAESFEGQVSDVLSIQDDMARAIAGRVRGTLSSQPGQASVRKQVRPEAYESYLLGLYFFDKREAQAAKKSVEYFKKSIAADADFAPAYAGLAEALPASKWFFDEPPIEVMAESLAAAKRALELDDRLGDAHTALGSLLSLYDWNWPAAERELQRGLELNPNSSLAHQRYAMYLQSVGRLPEAVLESKQALALDPVSFFINREMGRGLVLAGRYDEALEQFHRAEELGPPGPTVISLWISQVYQLQGREKDAISQRLQVEIDTTTDRNTSSKEIESLRHAYATGGSEGYWREVIQLHSSAKQPPPQPYYMALAEARLGHADKAWEWMEKSADQREVWVTWIKVDPLLEGVRSAPGYQRLLRRMHLEE